LRLHLAGCNRKVFVKACHEVSHSPSKHPIGNRIVTEPSIHGQVNLFGAMGQESVLHHFFSNLRGLFHPAQEFCDERQGSSSAQHIVQLELHIDGGMSFSPGPRMGS
jgi:hypothetical protein